MITLEEFRGVMERLGPKDFASDGRPKMKPLRKHLGDQITSTERDTLWDEHLTADVDHGMVKIMLTAAPCSPFTLTVNRRAIVTMRVGETKRLTSDQVMALAEYDGADFRYV